MRLDIVQLSKYLETRHGAAVEVLSVTGLSDKSVRALQQAGAPAKSLKVFGYGRPILIVYRVDGAERRVVLHTAAANQFGHETRADRAAELLLSYDTFNTLPNHAPALDVGLFTETGGLVSLAGGQEFFLVSQHVAGEAYAHDLQRLRDTGELTQRDRQRARRLAEYLAQIHSLKKLPVVSPPATAGEGAAPDLTVTRAALYRRRIRDTVGSGEGIMGLIDSYPADFPLVSADWLEWIEQRCIEWRWKLKDRTHRLAQVHGDFHPFNVLFWNDVDFYLLDRSRGAWGEPADDVSAMTINYLFFSLQRCGSFSSPFSDLWEIFWETYLDTTGDRELLDVIAPFFAWRALVLGSPIWYNTEDDVRRIIYHFLEGVLGADDFDPKDVDQYLR